MEERFRYGKVIFAKPNMDNVDDMVEMMNNEKIASMLFDEKRIFTRENEMEWVKRHQNDNNFSVYDKDTLEYIGNCGFNAIEDNRGEIGLTIREKMQGKHYAKDIVNGLIDYGYNTLGLDEIYAIVFSDNVKSLNCCDELGFVEYKRDKNVLERNGISVDDVYLRLENR